MADRSEKEVKLADAYARGFEAGKAMKTEAATDEAESLDLDESGDIYSFGCSALK